MRDDIRLGEQLTVLPGQIWLAEQASGEKFFAIDQAALADANVILYDRRLSQQVAELLPLGSYAEPLSAAAGAGVSQRALHFASEGWSVVQLVLRQPGQRPHLPRIGLRAELPVTAIAKQPIAPDHRDEGSVAELDRLIDGAGTDLLTLVFGPLSAVPAPLRQGHLFTAFGLAG
jgi:hypothetical protein